MLTHISFKYQSMTLAVKYVRHLQDLRLHMFKSDLDGFF